MEVINWFQVNSASIWFAVAVLVVLAVYLVKRLQSGEDPQAIALALANEAIAAALIVVRGAADQVQRKDLDVIVAYLYTRLPVLVTQVFSQDKLQQMAWELFTELHTKLDAQEKARLIGLVNKGRSVTVKA